MMGTPDEPTLTPIDVDKAGVCVLGAIDSSCQANAGFAVAVDGALRAALAILAHQPESTRALFEPSRDVEVASHQEHWRQTFAARLRGAARRAHELPPLPDFMESYLIDAIHWSLRRRVLYGESEQLLELAPELLSHILIYYLGAERAVAASAAAAPIGPPPSRASNGPGPEFPPTPPRAQTPPVPRRGRGEGR
jgi:hypothetical protein